jgi:predicted TIM-barrel fold metal-dependent hydrolase
MVNTFMRGRNVAHRDFWPFYEACADLGMAVGFHAAGGDAMDPVCHFDMLLAMHTFSHAPEQIMTCTAVIYSGLLEQFPTLRVAFLEAGAGWVPFWMEHMDGEWSKRKFDAPLLKMPQRREMIVDRAGLGAAHVSIALSPPAYGGVWRVSPRQTNR